jgi:hypothetical protein
MFSWRSRYGVSAQEESDVLDLPHSGAAGRLHPGPAL